MFVSKPRYQYLGLLPGAARSQNAVKGRNVVLVHGAYADGSKLVGSHALPTGLWDKGDRRTKSVDMWPPRSAFWLCRMVDKKLIGPGEIRRQAEGRDICRFGIHQAGE